MTGQTQQVVGAPVTATAPVAEESAASVMEEFSDEASENNFDDELLEEIGRIDAPPKDEIEQPPTAVEAEPQEAKPSSPAPSQPTEAAVTPSAGVPTQQPAIVPTAQPVVPQKTSEEIMKEVQQRLEKDYALTSEEATDFIARTEDMVPRMLAKVHAKAVSDTLGVVRQMLPEMIRENTRKSSEVETAAKEFFEAAPFLVQHRDNPLIGQVAQLVARTEPGLSKQEFIKKVAMGAASLLGVQPTLPAGKASVQEVRNKPAIVVQGNRMSSAGSAISPGKAKENEFSALARDFERDDSE